MKNTSTKTRLITVGAVGTALLGGGLATAGSAHAASGSVWDGVAACESGGNWSINTGNGFSGGLQFTQSTWAAYGGTAYASSAAQASRSAQIAVAQKVLAGQGAGAWPVCSKKAGLSRGNGGSSAAAPQRAAQQQTSRSTTRPSVRQQTSTRTYTPKTQVRSSAPKSQVRTFAPKSEVRTFAPSTHVRHSAPTVYSQSTGRTVTVHAGDTLSKLAARYDVKGGWQALFAMNKATVNNPNLIFVGQHLAI